MSKQAPSTILGCINRNNKEIMKPVNPVQSLSMVL